LGIKKYLNIGERKPKRIIRGKGCSIMFGTLNNYVAVDIIIETIRK